MLAIATLAVALAFALLTAVNQQGGGSPAQAASKQRVHTKAHRAAKHRHKAKAKHRARTAQAAEQPGAESGTETPGAESGTEPAGEAPDGYEDPNGQNVDHQCPPDCGPGEQG
jgi:hypothetical protein